MIIPEDYIKDSLESYIKRLSTRTHIIYIVVLSFVIIALLLLPFIEIDITCQELGIVRPAIEKAIITSPATELVKEVFVVEGQHVEKDQLLLSLRSSIAQNDIDYRKTKLQDIKNQIQDLTFLSKGRVPKRFLSEERFHEYTFYQNQWQKQSVIVEQAAKEYDRSSLLYKKHIISQSEYDQYRYDYDSKKLELAIIEKNQITKWASALSAYKKQEIEESSIIQQSSESKKILEVHSPVDGVLDTFSGIYPGSLLQMGQSICVISPDSTLCVDIYVSPKNIGYIFPGQKVKLQITSFDYNQWGFVDGNVISVSSDYERESSGQLYYIVKCNLERDFLSFKKTGRKRNIKKGMNVIAHFLLTRQSLFSLLYKNLDDWINPIQSLDN